MVQNFILDLDSLPKENKKKIKNYSSDYFPGFGLGYLFDMKNLSLLQLHKHCSSFLFSSKSFLVIGLLMNPSSIRKHLFKRLNLAFIIYFMFCFVYLNALNWMNWFRSLHNEQKTVYFEMQVSRN